YGWGASVRRAELGRVLRSSFIPAPFHYLALFSNPRFWAMFRPWELLAVPWVGGGLLATLGVDPMTDGPGLDGLTLSDLIEGWPPMLRAFVIALARSGLSADPHATPLAGFLAFLHFYTLTRRDAGAFDFLQGDAETEIIEPLADALRRAGGEIALGARATGLEPAADGAWRVRWERTPGATDGGWGEGSAGSILAGAVILAADAPGVQRIIERSPALAAEAAPLRWPRAQPTITVRMWFGRAPERGEESGMFGGDFTVDNFFWLHRFQTAFAEWHRATGGGAVEAHLYSPPELLAQPDAAVLAHAVSDVVRASPELRGALLHTELRRNPATHTLFAIGAAEEHLGVETPWPGLFCAGDWVRHPSPALFLERATVTGTAAANGVLVQRGLPTVPLLPPAPPEPLAACIAWAARRAYRLMKAVRGKRTRRGQAAL
ncbi:MAG: hypothetical protein NTZ05_21345, partial [Chloroflexi bacterium]|nr:hypothetical protein [Chloroflexota bacterium]